MKNRIIYSLEVSISVLVVGGLLWVAFYVKPTAEVSNVTPALFGFRNNFYGVSVSDGRIVWVVGSGGHIIRSEDGGDSWHLQKSPVSKNMQDIASWDEKSAVVIGDEGTVLTTSNSGQTWDVADAPIRKFGEQLLQVYVEKGTDRAWVTGAFGTVLRSEDRGATWTMVHPKEDVALNDVTKSPGGTMWLVGERGLVQRSNNGGATWVDVSIETGISLMSIAFADADNGMIVGLSGTIFCTKDGGKTWSIVPTRIKSHLFDVQWTGSGYVAVGDAGMIGRTDQISSNWTFSRLADNNFNWHTASAPVASSKLYIAGADPGVMINGEWRAFEQRVPQ